MHLKLFRIERKGLLELADGGVEVSGGLKCLGIIIVGGPIAGLEILGSFQFQQGISEILLGQQDSAGAPVCVSRIFICLFRPAELL